MAVLSNFVKAIESFGNGLWTRCFFDSRFRARDASQAIENGFTSLTKFHVNRNGSAQAIAGATFTQVQFNNIRQDEHSDFSVVDYYFTAPEAGYYMLGAHVTGDTIDDGESALLYLYQSTVGVGTPYLYLDIQTGSTNGADEQLQGCALVKLATGQKIGVGFRNSGATSLLGAITDTYFWGFRVL